MKNFFILLSMIAASATAAAQESSLRDQAMSSLQRGVEFFRRHVAVEGTYLWQYSEDFSKREGEGKATATQAWVQPPGTPSVGLAYLTAFQASGDRAFLEAARETAHGLVRGQLRSGGWHYAIEFNPQGRRKIAYRDGGGQEKARNVTTLDDDTTQAALRFLMRMDQALRCQDAKIHESVEYALVSLLKAQYPNGAWPQGYEQFPDPEKFQVKKASYPETWSRTWPGSSQYWLRYTLNDNALATMMDTLFEAERTYRDPSIGQPFNQLAAQCRAAVEKAGDFLLRAQMPEPQPAWAQQYDFEMHPAWARKFEPPSVTGGESQRVLRTLMKLYRETGQRKYLEPVPRALEYLRQSRLPDGRLARFYEFRSNKPLYFTKDYQLTYDDSDMPTHYAFKVSNDLEGIAREYERLKNLSPSELQASPPAARQKVPDSLVSQVKSVIAAQDSRGRWVEESRLRYHGPDDPTTRVIRCATFIEHVETLSGYLAATRRPGSIQSDPVR